jgi:ubiquinone/menaquinone biosynthesis C-methylase UbiE
VGVDWQDRLTQMETWYHEFLGQGAEEAERTLMWEHRPYAERLSRFRGRVIDVGGGAGLARRFLSENVDYWVVDPGQCWQTEGWQEFSSRFHNGPIHFVTGVGEDLPFGDAEFDGALALWSFNHASDPGTCLSEIHRVLKPGGKSLIVLEDMEPTLSDTWRLWLQEQRERLGRRAEFPIAWHQDEIQTAAQTLRHRLKQRTWPLQPDHVRVEEAQLRAVMQGRFKMLNRSWAGGFLFYDMEKLPESGAA